ncbi:unnamed protein product [Kuraishia capsulata CBS 1993]|uniref:Ammonium transporter n=1 Tax=Kuraishia capsulata CBS 1993 TaxID=1382522 RepID=W6MX03_9ASCO|nr:uncharacterized protein KUCA_T00004031001 [Kuraishia capsulata CBS 1993]CDK28050.1 unnamed protein product [Kuraishia capsulata CBS 1993]
MLNLTKRAAWAEQAGYDEAQIAMLAVGSAMVLFMCPGLAYLYSGLARRKSALHMVWIVMAACLVAIFQWYFWGYSLAFSGTATNKFIGNLHNFGYQNLERDAGGYPEMLFANFQGMFLCVTVCIVVGCIAERGRVFPCLVFCFMWATLVYCPVACWVWNTNGWAYKWGVLDYAGGGPVEILSGFSAFVYSAVLGRRNETMMVNFRPHNVSMVTIGTSFLWFGWLGFNGFSCLTPSLKVPYSIMNSNLCAAFGGLTWCILDWRIERKWSTVGLCSGIICGLVAATPTSGIIPLWASVILGVFTSIVCNFSTKIKFWLRVDDSMDVMAEHGMAGVIGLLFNGIFGSSAVIGYDGVTEHGGGWIDHNWKQLYIQVAYIAACVGYSCVVTAIICLVLNRIPGCNLRAPSDGEERGMDEDQIGEFAYDYVEVRRDFLSWGETKNALSVNGEEPEPLLGAGYHESALAGEQTHETDKTRGGSDHEKDGEQ